MASINDGLRHEVGNHKNVRLTRNSGSLQVVGNHAHLVVDHNEGVIQVTGDDCRLEVAYNAGRILCTGNRGRLEVGEETASSQVRFTGGGCVVNRSKSTPKPTATHANGKRMFTTHNVRTAQGAPRVRVVRERTIDLVSFPGFDIDDWCFNFTKGFIIS